MLNLLPLYWQAIGGLALSAGPGGGCVALACVIPTVASTVPPFRFGPGFPLGFARIF